MAKQAPIPQTASGPSQLVRAVQAIIFVGAWMALGWLFHLDVYSYLLVGIPLVVTFHLLVRKKPLVALWIRNADRFRLNGLQIILALALAAWSTVFSIKTLRKLAVVSSHTTWSWWSHTPETLWLFKILLSVCCIIGSFGAVFAFCQFTRQTWRDLAFCLLTAGGIGIALALARFIHFIITDNLAGLSGVMIMSAIWRFLNYLITDLPMFFVVEEVVFRGAIDSHVFQPGDKGKWWTAVLVSGLWGLWHLPFKTGFWQWIIVVICLVIPIGISLSFGWRRSGNLAVSSTTHSFLDALSHI